MQISEIPVVATLPLWSEQWNKEALQRRRKAIGETAYARGFQQKALSDKDAPFAGLIERCLVSADWKSIVRDEWPRYGGVDLAGEKRPGTVIFTLAKDPETGKKYPIEIVYGKWQAGRTVTELEAAYQRHKHQRINVETNGLQKILVDWIAKTDGKSRFAVKAFVTGAQKSHPEYGVPGMAVEMENGAWAICTGDKEHEYDCRCGLCLWLKELKAWPVGATTDVVMASWFASEAARKSTASVRWL